MTGTDYVSLIGFAAGILTTGAFLPQVIKTWRTRSTEDLSLPMWSALFIGIVLWVIYGFLTNDIPLIVANSVTLALSAIVLFLKIKHG